MKMLLIFLLLTFSTTTHAEMPGEQFTQPLGIQLLKTDIPAIQAKFGNATVTSEGHDGDVVCYVRPQYKELFRFLIGREGIGAAFELRRLPPKVSSYCMETSAHLGWGDIEVAGLKLGITRAQFDRAIGTHTKSKEGLVVAHFSRVQKITNQAGASIDLYIDINIEGRFVKGHLVELIIWKTAST